MKQIGMTFRQFRKLKRDSPSLHAVIRGRQVETIESESQEELGIFRTSPEAATAIRLLGLCQIIDDNQ